MRIALQRQDETLGAGPAEEEGALQSGSDLFGLEGVTENDGDVIGAGGAAASCRRP
ncbi:hypothetical protein ACTWQF_18330 [Streptomyces sp. 8N114]|uniref:hypothetical protein n=1 Tax=Streptomyces sp. 8N114 TaxID=3457419 RepID=UPI003FD4D1D9